MSLLELPIPRVCAYSGTLCIVWGYATPFLYNMLALLLVLVPAFVKSRRDDSSNSAGSSRLRAVAQSALAVHLSFAFLVTVAVASFFRWSLQPDIVEVLRFLTNLPLWNIAANLVDLATLLTAMGAMLLLKRSATAFEITWTTDKKASACAYATLALVSLILLHYLLKVSIQPDGALSAPLLALAHAPRLQTYAQSISRLAFIVLVAPVAEELLFRAILFGALRPVTGPYIATLLQALVFSFIHGFTIYTSEWFVFAVACQLCYLRTRALAVPIAVHVARNLVGVLGYA